MHPPSRDNPAARQDRDTDENIQGSDALLRCAESEPVGGGDFILMLYKLGHWYYRMVDINWLGRLIRIGQEQHFLY